MGLPPPLSIALALALTGALAGCGGGTTGRPVAATTAANPAPAPVTKPLAPSTVAGVSTHPGLRRTTATSPTAARTAQRSAGSDAPASRRAAATTPASSAASASVRASVPAPPAPRPDPAAKPAGTPIDELADLTLTRRASPSHYFQQGTVTGTYAGTMAVEARITSQGVLVSFTATVPGGTIVGHALAVAILDSATWPGLRGSGEITGGTGRFAGIRGRKLTVTGRARPDASQAHVRLAGTVSY